MCTEDSSITCAGSSAAGYTCEPVAGGVDLGPGTTTLACTGSVPNPVSGWDDFCCFAWTYGTSTCTPDRSVSWFSCPGMYGFLCSAGSAGPAAIDAQLRCGAGVADGTQLDFCCTH